MSMRLTLVFHILSGTIGLLAGYAALASTKGAPLHRRSGIVFVASMLAMAAGGLVISIGRGIAPAINVPSALLASYLATTGLTTVRVRSSITRRIDLAGMFLGFALATGCALLAAVSVSRGGAEAGLAYPLVLFGAVSAIAATGDARVMRGAAPTGRARLARHLWRMCFALFIASLAFFIGQADVFPEPIRIRPLLALPVPAVLVIMWYWLWRIRRRGTGRALSHVST